MLRSDRRRDRGMQQRTGRISRTPRGPAERSGDRCTSRGGSYGTPDAAPVLAAWGRGGWPGVGVFGFRDGAGCQTAPFRPRLVAQRGGAVGVDNAGSGVPARCRILSLMAGDRRSLEVRTAARRSRACATAVVRSRPRRTRTSRSLVKEWRTWALPPSSPGAVACLRRIAGSGIVGLFGGRAGTGRCRPATRVTVGRGLDAAVRGALSGAGCGPVMAAAC